MNNQNNGAPKRRLSARRVPTQNQSAPAKAEAQPIRPQSVQNAPSAAPVRPQPAPPRPASQMPQEATLVMPSVQQRITPEPQTPSVSPPRQTPPPRPEGQSVPKPRANDATRVIQRQEPPRPARPQPRPAQPPQNPPTAPGAPTPNPPRRENAQPMTGTVRGINFVQAGSAQPRPGASQSGAPRPGQGSSSPARAKAPDKKQKKKKKIKVRYEGQSTLTSLLKAITYIIFVLVVAGFASYYIIVVGNDVFAFVKEASEIEVTLPENATIDDIAEELYEEGVIEYPSIFKLYTQIRRKELAKYSFVAGDHIVSPSMNYDYLFKAFLPVKTREIVQITIPEGYTVDNIIDLFVSYGMNTREEYIDVIENGDFSEYWFVNELEGNTSPDRRYRLEGYLFPDTYQFYTDATPRAVLLKLLDNFKTKFDLAYKERCNELGMTVDEVVVLASMIQMEAKYADEYGRISSVFHNRLSSDRFMRRLDSDATIQYALGYDRKTTLTGEDTKLDSPYNTYRNSGLPPGPITNPSLNAISYALYPEKTNYYYFVAQASGYSLFAETEEEHIANINKARGNS